MIHLSAAFYDPHMLHTVKFYVYPSISVALFGSIQIPTEVLRTIVSKVWFCPCFSKLGIAYNANLLLFKSTECILKPHCGTFYPINISFSYRPSQIRGPSRLFLGHLVHYKAVPKGYSIFQSEI